MAKRIREVYPSDMVAHLWAHQSQQHARNGRNLRFDGPALVSYSTTIGRMVQDKDGNRVALLSEHTYSPTTAGQIRDAESACRNVVPVYRVNHGLGDRYGADMAQQHAANVKSYLDQYAGHMGKALKGSKYNMDWRMRQGESILATAKSYAEAFAVQVDQWPDHVAQVVAICADQKRREDKRNDPKQVAKREAAKAAAAARIRRDYRNATGKYGPDVHLSWRECNRLDDMMTADDRAARSESLTRHNAALLARWASGDGVHLPWGLYPTADDKLARSNAIRERMPQDVATYLDGREVYSWFFRDIIWTDAEKAQREAAFARQFALDIAAWRAGHSLPHRVPRGSSAMLRLRGDTIETSWGASFPASHGAKAFPLLARIHASGQAWQRNGHTIHLGHFQVDRVDPDGTVHAGCHVVRWAEIEGIAREMGLLGAEAHQPAE